MDQTLIDLFRLSPDNDTAELEFRFGDPRTGEIEITLPSGTQKYVLKPLADLYGKGSGALSINWNDKGYMALLYAIEESIIEYDDEVPDLSDGLVSLALDRLAANPATDTGNDRLAQRLQMRLRLTLSLNDYSKQEVKLAIKKIAKSVESHSAVHGIRGYLEFIRRQFRR